MERFALWSFVFMRIIIEGPTTGGLQLHLTLPTLQEGLMLPEKEEYRIELFKDERRGLGITVAGYVCEKGKGGRSRGPGFRECGALPKPGILYWLWSLFLCVCWLK